MRTWIQYFVGTPQRFTATFLVIAGVVVLAKPGLLNTIVGRILSELAPLAQLALVIAIMLLGIRIIIFGRK